MKYEKCKVVMLPTEKSRITKGMTSTVSGLQYNPDERLIVQDGAGTIFVQPQHLYILSDEEIKEGDHFINIQTLNLGNPASVVDLEIIVWSGSPYKKIIATTDIGLGIQETPQLSISLPRPSNEFIQAYCKKGGIDEILVEYDYDYTMPSKLFESLSPSNKEKFLELKVAPDNTITIKPATITFKDMFDMFIDERIKLASSSQTESAYTIVKEFVNKYYKP